MCTPRIAEMFSQVFLQLSFNNMADCFNYTLNCLLRIELTEGAQSTNNYESTVLSIKVHEVYCQFAKVEFCHLTGIVVKINTEIDMIQVKTLPVYTSLDFIKSFKQSKSGKRTVST